ncbi:hypothetical protein FXF51_41680 [Nonomuraea sp. PA05]|uniref:hypothetical protein n=1 Tax=Nonomuraea sp. PA05 TaxID=2604466 RepID=UPI0011D81D0B|nr:hypothetical protein [Nonomuraea sp. PA05]TYB56995.1 hypothetical protein FXF51_41680 [Nonomuraea sp. PA05]
MSDPTIAAGRRRPPVTGTVALCAVTVLLTACTAARAPHSAPTPAAPTPAATTAAPRKPSPIRTAQGRGWRLAHVGGKRGTRLRAVAASGPRDVWALGAPNEGSGKVLLVHFDGRRWREHPAPGLTWSFGDARGFPDLVATGPRDAWIFATAPTLTAHHWDGERWTRIALPDLDHDPGERAGAAALAPDDVWLVVGDHAAHWDGKDWTVMRLPAWATSVSAVAPDQVWAVGGTGRPLAQGSTGSQAATMRWDGRSWQLVATPEDRTPSTEINSEGRPDGSIPRITLTQVVAHAPDNVWAIGTRQVFDYEDGSRQSTITMRWDGKTWSWMPGAAGVSAAGSDGAGGIVLAVWDTSEGGLSGTIRVAPDGSRTELPPMTGANRDRELDVSALGAVPGARTVYAVGVAYGKEFGPMIARYR